MNDIVLSLQQIRYRERQCIIVVELHRYQRQHANEQCINSHLLKVYHCEGQDSTKRQTPTKREQMAGNDYAMIEFKRVGAHTTSTVSVMMFRLAKRKESEGVLCSSVSATSSDRRRLHSPIARYGAGNLCYMQEGSSQSQ